MKKGFTLVELLIVMAVIAILIGIAIPSFRGMQQEANKTKAEGDLRVLKIAIESYYKNNAVYPAVANYQTTLLGATPKILESNLYDPFGATSTTTYAYALGTGSTGPSDAKYYIVYSVGINAGGTAAVNNTTGLVTVGTGDAVGAIWSSNGHL
jgi:prepilin-type N-terminal cleavage/methylation domain-containing protein